MNILIGLCVGIFLMLAIIDLFSMKDKSINQIYIDFAKLVFIGFFLFILLFMLNGIFRNY